MQLREAAVADDIVTRLRAYDADGWEGADEIERLRAAGDEMADAATRQQWSRLDVAVAAWLEARCG